MARGKERSGSLIEKIRANLSPKRLTKAVGVVIAFGIALEVGDNYAEIPARRLAINSLNYIHGIGLGENEEYKAVGSQIAEAVERCRSEGYVCMSSTPFLKTVA